MENSAYGVCIVSSFLAEIFVSTSRNCAKLALSTAIRNEIEKYSGLVEIPIRWNTEILVVENFVRVDSVSKSGEEKENWLGEGSNIKTHWLSPLTTSSISRSDMWFSKKYLRCNTWAQRINKQKAFQVFSDFFHWFTYTVLLYISYFTSRWIIDRPLYYTSIYI